MNVRTNPTTKVFRGEATSTTRFEGSKSYTACRPRTSFTDCGFWLQHETSKEYGIQVWSAVGNSARIDLQVAVESQVVRRGIPVEALLALASPGPHGTARTSALGSKSPVTAHELHVFYMYGYFSMNAHSPRNRINFRSARWLMPARVAPGFHFGDNLRRSQPTPFHQLLLRPLQKTHANFYA